MSSERIHVVIIGGGFGGLNAAKKLAGKDVDVTLIDRRNHHLFQPLLYQVATAALTGPDVAEPLRKILQDAKNVRVVMDEARDIDRERRRVILTENELDYDYLIVAAGATTTYFGNDDWEEHAPGLKSIDNALDIRRKVLLAYEHAERIEDPEIRKQWLTFVVVGAGPTGVEMAGALSEIATKTLARDFRSFETSEARVILAEGLDRVLPNFPEEMSGPAREQLEELGVEVRLGEFVEDIREDGVQFEDEFIPARNVVWAAGIGGEPIGGRLGVERVSGNSVPVDEDLTLPGDDRIFVVGDLAHFDHGGEPLPGLAPVAIQQGEHAAKNILRAVSGKEFEPFEYLDKGVMATIGRKRAVAKVAKPGGPRSWTDGGGWHFSGVLAWLAWLFIHILYLVGFRNRVFVLMEWFYAYLSYNRSARVILQRPVRRLGTSAVEKQADVVEEDREELEGSSEIEEAGEGAAVEETEEAEDEEAEDEEAVDEEAVDEEAEDEEAEDEEAVDEEAVDEEAVDEEAIEEGASGEEGEELEEEEETAAAQ